MAKYKTTCEIRIDRDYLREIIDEVLALREMFAFNLTEELVERIMASASTLETMHVKEPKIEDPEPLKGGPYR